MIGKSGERGSGISVLAAQHDDDDDDVQSVFTNHIFNIYVKTGFGIKLLTMVDIP